VNRAPGKAGILLSYYIIIRLHSIFFTCITRVLFYSIPHDFIPSHSRGAAAREPQSFAELPARAEADLTASAVLMAGM